MFVLGRNTLEETSSCLEGQYTNSLTKKYTLSLLVCLLSYWKLSLISSISEFLLSAWEQSEEIACPSTVCSGSYVLMKFWCAGLRNSVLRWLVDLFGQRDVLQSFLALLCSFCILLFYSCAFFMSSEVKCRVQKLSALEFFNFCVIVLSPFLKR